MNHPNIPFQYDERRSVLIAAVNAPDSVKEIANYICDGIADEHEINQAIIDGNWNIELSKGKFSLNADTRYK